jgi:hypothetical protein
MKPLYFPFTYVSDPVVEALTACLGTIRVYQLSSDSVPADMQSWMARGRLESAMPLQEIATRLKQASRFCYDWARDHEADLDPFLMNVMDRIPYYDETSAFRLRSEISRTSGRRQAAKPLFSGQEVPDDGIDDEVFKAALFLQMAQDFDIRQTAVQSGLQSLDVMRQQVMASLKGDEEGTDASDSLSDGMTENWGMIHPAGDDRIEERLAAWTRLLQHDPDPGGIFVTTSRSVMTRLLETCPALRQMAEISCERGQAGDAATDRHRQEECCRYLERLARDGAATVPADGEDQGATAAGIFSGRILRVYLAADTTPPELFCRATGLNSTLTDHSEGGSHYRHTVIVCLHGSDGQAA